jgi:transcriptional regulator with XRE-family HTH domain
MGEQELRPTPNVRINRDRLRRRRQIMGLNQARLAEEAGLSFSYIGHLERGIRPNIGPEAFVRLCDALGIEDREELIDDDDEAA